MGITIYLSEREPIGPYRITIPARRTRRLRFNDPRDPELVPRDTDCSSVIVSDVPNRGSAHPARLRQAADALFSAIAFPGTQ